MGEIDEKKGGLAERLTAAPGLFLIFFTLIYAAGMALCNARRAFWIDELFTYFLADLPSIGKIWPLIAKGIELNPPLPFWLTWAVHHTLGHGEIVTRLPSTAGFWAMCICLFHIVRRRADVVHGFIALLLPLFTYTLGEATWARGYGLMLGFSAFALLCWQLASDGVRRIAAVGGIALGIAGAVSCHYYAVYCAGALALGELTRTIYRKRIDFAIWAAIGIGLSPLGVYAPLIESSARHLGTFWVTPVSTYVYQAYADLLSPIMAVFLLLLVAAQWVGPMDREERARGLEKHECVAYGALCAMPLVLYVAGLLGPVACYPRYVQPLVIGYCVLMTMFAYRYVGSSGQLRSAVVTLLVWFCLMPWFAWQLAKVEFFKPPGPKLMEMTNFAVEPELPLVIDNDEDFFEMRHYAPKPISERLFMLLDGTAAVKYLGSDTTLRSLAVAQTVGDQHVRDFHEFVGAHEEFLVVRTRSTSWIQQYLIEQGAELKLLSLNKPRGPFVEETMMFHVSMRH